MKRRWKWWDTTLRDPEGYQDAVNMIPNKVGNYETANQCFRFGSANTVTGTVINADALQVTDGSVYLFACTATKIYRVTAFAVIDFSFGGGSYTTATMWNGAQYGDISLYTSYTNNVQASSGGAAFAALAGTPPKAKYIATQSLAVALAGYNDGVNTYLDGIWISDIGDHTTWTPSASNEAANFRLLQTPGPITGIWSFKGDFLVSKANSLYRLSYVGLPTIWQAQLVSGSIGVAAQGMACVCDDNFILTSPAGWYAFNGQSFTQLAPNSGARGTGYPSVHSGSSPSFDPSSGLVHFAAPANPRAIVFQLTPGEGFGAAGSYLPTTASATPTVRALVRGTPAALTVLETGALSYPSAPIYFLASGSDSIAYTLSEVWGSVSTSVPAYVLTNFFGRVQQKTNFKMIVPLLGYWTGGYSYSGSCNYITCERSDLYQAGATVPSTAATSAAAAITPRFTLNKTTRFLAAMIDAYTSPMEIEDIIIESTPAGRE